MASAHNLWQPHAESLRYLTTIADTALSAVEPVLATARQRGLVEKVEALEGAIETIRSYVSEAAEAVQR